MENERKAPNPWWGVVAPYEALYKNALAGDFAGVARHNITARGPAELAFILGLAKTSFGAAPSEGRALDVGCGAGYIAGAASALGFEATGIDLSPAAIELARRLHPSLRFEVMDGAAPSFAVTETFDLIVIRAFHPFMRSADFELHQRIIRTYLGRLTPGGVLAVMNPEGPESLDGSRVAETLRRAGWRVRGPVFPFFALRLPGVLSSGLTLDASSAASRLLSRTLHLGLPWTMLVMGPRKGDGRESPQNTLLEAS